MQQYFTNGLVNTNVRIQLEAEVVYHIRKVLRKTDGYVFRIADGSKKIYEAVLDGNFAIIGNCTNEENELSTDITVILSLIKNDKFDYALQKLTELGVKRIVPFKANRSVVKEGKGTNKLDRFRKIVREASEQSHRNIIPEICDFADIKDIDKYLSEINLIAYEKETVNLPSLKTNSVTIVIGPEGGFEDGEVNEFIKHGFVSVSLGNRILRAETAALYLTSVIVGANQ